MDPTLSKKGLRGELQVFILEINGTYDKPLEELVPRIYYLKGRLDSYEAFITHTNLGLKEGDGFLTKAEKAFDDILTYVRSLNKPEINKLLDRRELEYPIRALRRIRGYCQGQKDNIEKIVDKTVGESEARLEWVEGAIKNTRKRLDLKPYKTKEKVK